MGEVSDEESQGPSLSKDLKLERLKRQCQYSSLFGTLEDDQPRV